MNRFACTELLFCTDVFIFSGSSCLCQCALPLKADACIVHLSRHKRRVQLLGLQTSRSWPSGPQKAIWYSTTLPDTRNCQSWESIPALSPVLHGTTQKYWQWVQQTSRYRMWSCHQYMQVMQLMADMRSSRFATNTCSPRSDFKAAAAKKLTTCTRN